MSVFNTDLFLIRRAIDSVLNQTFQNFELIIIDDGSDNGTQSHLKEYANHSGNRIKYLQHVNCGQAESINRGVLMSEGEYITILDADDEYKPNHLMSCLREMNHVDLIASTTKTIVDKEADYYVPDKHNYNDLIHVDQCILFATLFGKREVFNKLKFLGSYASDAHFYERASLIFKVKKVNLRTYIYYRNIPGSTSAKLKRKTQKSLKAL